MIEKLDCIGEHPYNINMRTIPREVVSLASGIDPVETTRRRLQTASKSELEMYLLGAFHDATFSSKHQTIRFSQSDIDWLKILQIIFVKLGSKSWIYKEGKQRSVWALETTAKLTKLHSSLTDMERVMYIKGYFDAEGGMPRSKDDFLYFQFSQKDKSDLEKVKTYLEELGINCGLIHNPSKKVDANYWRFFVSRNSHKTFMKLIYSFHPRKMRQMDCRMKI